MVAITAKGESTFPPVDRFEEIDNLSFNCVRANRQCHPD